MNRFLGLALVGLLASVASAQTDELFIGHFTSFSVAQSGTVNRTWPTASGLSEFGLAVSDGTVRVKYGSTNANNYSTGGMYLGSSASAEPFIYDGTTDGVAHNYGVELAGTGVFRYDLNWQNPVHLFSLTGSGGVGWNGVTYDSSNGSLWVADWVAADTTIRNVALDGSVLSEFQAGVGRLTGLAYERSTRTIWAADETRNGTILQFDTSGTLLQTITVPGVGTVYGLEFEVPAPSTASLLIVGVAVIGCRRRDVRTRGDSTFLASSAGRGGGATIRVPTG